MMHLLYCETVAGQRSLPIVKTRDKRFTPLPSPLAGDGLGMGGQATVDAEKHPHPRPLSHPGRGEKTKCRYCDVAGRGTRTAQPLLTSSPRGAILVIVIVCLVLATMILGALLKSTLLLSRQLGVEQQHAQAAWLTSAGLSRAAHYLRSQPDYGSETWQIAPDMLGTNAPARVEIRVAAPTGQTNSRDVVIEVEYPADAARPISLTRQATVIVSQEVR